MACIVLGLMHTGTNVWHLMKHCHGCRGASDQPWKHVPVHLRSVTPSQSCQIYVTERNCDDWIGRMKKNSYELQVVGDEVRQIKPGDLKVQTEQRNKQFAAALPIPLREMCEAHNKEAIRLQAEGAVRVLHFDDICNQTNRPKADAREWLKRDSHKCVAVA